MTSVHHLAHGKTFLNRLVHDDEIGSGDERHEARDELPVAFDPMIDAGIPVFQFLRSDMRDDVLGTAIEFGSEIFGHFYSPLPHKAGNETCASLQVIGKKIPQPRREIRTRAASCTKLTQREHRSAPKSVNLRGKVS